jgi:hypothetical protein
MMLNIVMLTVVLLSVAMLTVVMLTFVMLIAHYDNADVKISIESAPDLSTSIFTSLLVCLFIQYACTLCLLLAFIFNVDNLR